MSKRLNKWKTWWALLAAMVLVWFGVWLNTSIQERNVRQAWINAQWAVQPTYTIPVCRAHQVDCKVLPNWELETFYYFPRGQVCPIQTRDGDCSDNWWIRPSELQAMEEFFFQTCWIQPGRFPPWWRINP